MACVHVLGMKEGGTQAHGIEDLPMLARLTAVLPASVEVKGEGTLQQQQQQ